MIDWSTAQITIRAVETTTGVIQEFDIPLVIFAEKLAERMAAKARAQHDLEELARARRFQEAEPSITEIGGVIR